MSGQRQAPLASGWSDLPQEILSKIVRGLDSSIDVFRLHSVCKNWHSSKKSNRNSILSPFLPCKISNNNLPFTTDRPHDPLTLVARAVFLVRPLCSSNDSNGWLLFVEEMLPGKLRILYPLSTNPVNYRSSNFPKYLDLSEFTVSEVAKSYRLKYAIDNEDNYVSGVRKVAMSCDGSTAMVLYGEGTLVGVRLKNGNWSYVRQSIICSFSDVITYNRAIYAIDCYGNVHTIDHKKMKVVSCVNTIVPRSFNSRSRHIRLLISDRGLESVDWSRNPNWALNVSLFIINRYNIMVGQPRQSWRPIRVIFASLDWCFCVYAQDLLHLSDSFRLSGGPSLVPCLLIFSETCFASSPPVYNHKPRMSRLFDGASVDLGIGVQFYCEDDKKFWDVNYSSTTDFLWPPPTWFWPDAYSSSGDDEENEDSLGVAVSKEQELEQSAQAGLLTGTMMRNRDTLARALESLALQ